MPSIRLNLLKWLIAPLLIINLIGAGLTYWLAWAPAQIAFDQSLADAAWALVPRLREIRGNIAIDLPQQAEQVLRVDHFDAIYFVVRSAEGKTITGDKIKHHVDRATAMFLVIQETHAGTPWAARAESELKRGYGVELFEVYHGPPRIIPPGTPIPPVPKL